MLIFVFSDYDSGRRPSMLLYAIALLFISLVGGLLMYVYILNVIFSFIFVA